MKQIIVVGSVIMLMAVLLSLDIKGLVKPKESRSVNSSQASEPATVKLTVETVSELSKQDLSAALSAEITELEKKLKDASEADKLAIQKQLAQKWNDVNQPAPSAFYYESIAQAENTLSNWMMAGDNFTAAFDNTQDTLIQPGLLQKVASSYQNALKLDPYSLDAKTGLGAAITNGAGSPMEGISLLREVVAKDPKNIKANMKLGLLSIKSGQYDKAVGRFKTVVEQKPIPEAWFYLASCYENQGMKDEAITAYLKSKELAADPNLGKFVDQKVQELRK